MAHINLLPWREWERERKKNQFLANLGVVLLIGAAIVFGFGYFLDGSIETQQSRNGYLAEKITVLDDRIEEISNLRQKRKELLDRMQVIQDLQGNRPVIVRIFDELVRTLSKGVHFKKLEMKDKALAVQGTAESNNRISSLMRNLDDSDWFASPNLKSIKESPNDSNYGAQASNFELTFVQTNPNVDEAEE